MADMDLQSEGRRSPHRCFLSLPLSDRMHWTGLTHRLILIDLKLASNPGLVRLCWDDVMLGREDGKVAVIITVLLYNT